MVRERHGAPLTLALLGATVGAWLLMAAVAPADLPVPPPGGYAIPHIGPSGPDHLIVSATSGGRIWATVDADGPLQPMEPGKALLPWVPEPTAERILVIPTSLQWRRPLPGLPRQSVLRMAEEDPDGRLGPVRLITRTSVDHGLLPVLSLVMSQGALFDPDSGLFVVGHAMLNGVVPEGITEDGDMRWWKYPGNFHGRGKEWERKGLVYMADPSGQELISSPVQVRIQGQMTRAFPQHAMRISFPDKVSGVPLTGALQQGTRSFILRAAGNDQLKAGMRDALLQQVCSGGYMEASASASCVLYINGAYWGIYEVRERVDEKEIARRHGLKAKQVLMAEVSDGSLEGDQKQLKVLKKLVRSARRWDGRSQGFLDSLEQQVHVDAFLEYMAIMLFVDNRDWPGDNVRLWRPAGALGEGKDVRWRPIFQDMDLAFGASSGPDADPVAFLRNANSPIAFLFLAMMKSPELRARFESVSHELLATRLAPARLLAHIDSLESLRAPEMERHIARWRRPASAEEWRDHVQVLRSFAQQRPATFQRTVLAKGAFQ